MVKLTISDECARALLRVLDAAMFDGDHEFPQEFFYQPEYEELDRFRDELANKIDEGS